MMKFITIPDPTPEEEKLVERMLAVYEATIDAESKDLNAFGPMEVDWWARAGMTAVLRELESWK